MARGSWTVGGKRNWIPLAVRKVRILYGTVLTSTMRKSATGDLVGLINKVHEGELAGSIDGDEEIGRRGRCGIG